MTVAYAHPHEVAYSWHRSMVEMVGWDIAHHGRVVRGGYIAIKCGTDGLVEARNQAVRDFLKENQAEWLFWVDTDMAFTPDTIDSLLAVADVDERPIMGALCFANREHKHDGAGGWRCVVTPTIFDWAHVEEQQGFAVRWDYPRNTVVKCAGTGSACILIHRSVFERVRDEFGEVWYNRVSNPTTGQLVSEDLAFCIRAGALGIPVHVHTGVATTHLKPIWVAEEDYWRQRALEPPPDADVSTGVAS